MTKKEQQAKMQAALSFMTTLLDILDRHFSRLHKRSCSFVELIPAEDLFRKPRDLPRTFTMFSCGEYVLRSAAAVEQCFGGITARQWDDPFEWTLPERLSTNIKIVEYLEDVEQTRQKGFAFFTSDDDLRRTLPSPGTLKSIFELLLETIARAEHFQGRAFAVFQMFSNEKLPTT
ncbi:MAG: hypothetical protein H7070_10895 [Saprospiraceae bacterium]|nr:hypothetical protein [Pyrinomonadaceae bacterium]